MYYFTEKEKEEKLNIVEFEDDEVLFKCQKIESKDENYILTGIAIIEGEVYNDFKIEVKTIEKLEKISAINILNSEWEWYDYIC